MLLYNDGRSYIIQYNREQNKLVNHQSLDSKYTFKSKDVQVQNGRLFVMEKDQVTESKFFLPVINIEQSMHTQDNVKQTILSSEQLNFMGISPVSNSLVLIDKSKEIINKSILLGASTCANNCLTCDASNNCLTCNEGQRYLSGNKCLCKPPKILEFGSLCLQCPQSSTYNADTNTCNCQPYNYLNVNKCQSCPTYCQQCSKITSGVVCTQCEAAMNRIMNISNDCICKDGYYDNGNVLCVQCPYNCKTCNASGSSPKCISCHDDPSYFRKQNSPQCDCLDGYYDNGVDSQCLKCPNKCQTCQLQGSQVVCLTCQSNQNRQSNTSTCDCLTGFYEDGINLICQQCPLKCKTCSYQNSQVVCLSCKDSSNFYRQQNPPICDCLDGYYENTITSTCQQCPSKCKTCQLQNSQVDCLSCNDSLNSNRNQIAPSCECIQGYYENPLTLVCQQCPLKCKTCSFQNQQIICLSCDDNPNSHRSQINPTCDCIQGYYEDSNYICQKCPLKCKTCQLQNSQVICLNCDDNPNSFRKNITESSTCDCLDGYFEDQSNGTCQQCKYNCKTCQNINTCLSCPDNSFRKAISSSQTCDCIDGYFDGGSQVCSLCSQFCKTCQNNLNNCLSCDINLGRVLNNNKCECSGNYSENIPPQKECLKVYECHGSCQTCRGNTENLCEVCKPDREFKQVLSQMLCKCKQGYFEQTSTLDCGTCDQSCLTCSNAGKNNCLSCDESTNRRLDTSTNTCKCKPGFVEINNICVPCHQTCKECFGISENNCLSCYTDTQIRTLLEIDNQNKLCVCGRNYFDNKLNNDFVCQICDGTCKTCSGSQKNQCLSCFEDTQLRKYDQITKQCECLTGYESINNNDICTKIPQCTNNCETCSRQILSQCLSCNDNQNRELQNNACKCKLGYFEQLGVPECQKCDQICQTCIDSSSNCTSCNPKTHQLNIQNKKCECIDGTYFDQSLQQCKKCSSNCKTCQEKETTCTSCQQNYKLNTFQLCQEIFPTNLSNETIRNVYNITESSTYVAIGATATGTVVLAFASPSSSIAAQFILLQKLNFLLLIDTTYPELIYIFFKALGGSSPIDILQKFNLLNYFAKDQKGNMLPGKFSSEQIGESIIYNGGGCISLIVIFWGAFIPFLILYKQNKLIENGLQSYSTRAHLLKILIERIFTFLIMIIHQIISLIVTFTLVIQLTSIFEGVSNSEQQHQPLRIAFCVILLIYFLGITLWWSQILNNPQYYQSLQLAKLHKDKVQVQIFLLSNNLYRSSWLFHIRNYKIAYLVTENIFFPLVITIFHNNFKAQAIICLVLQSILLITTISIRPYYSKLQNLSIIIEQVCWVVIFTMILVIGIYIERILNKTSISDHDIHLMDQLSWVIVFSCLITLFCNPIIVFIQILINYKQIWLKIKQFYRYIKKNICCYVEDSSEKSFQGNIRKPLNTVFDNQQNFQSNRVKQTSILRKNLINQSFLQRESIQSRQSVKFSKNLNSNSIGKISKQSRVRGEFEMERQVPIQEIELKSKDIDISQNNLTNNHLLNKTSNKQLLNSEQQL